MIFRKISGFARLILIRVYCKIRVNKFRLLSSCRVSGSPKCIQPVLMIGAGKIEISDDVKIGFFPSPYFFSTYAHIEARGEKSIISIGCGTFLNNNFCAIAEHSSISIGRDCLVGFNVEITDSNFHGVEVESRRRSRPEWALPVVIGNNVFIGSNVKILKGVKVGDGSVIANGSIVTREIPPNSVFGGNPAKLIKVLES